MDYRNQKKPSLNTIRNRSRIWCLTVTKSKTTVEIPWEGSHRCSALGSPHSDLG